MSYVSFTLPGKTRGPHEHLRQTDVFSFIGPADFKIVLWDNREKSKTYMNRLAIIAGNSNPVTLIIPPGVVHGYKNISSIAGSIINCPDRLYRGHGKRNLADEIRHENSKDEFYRDFLSLCSGS
jgi:dTDP-4-dehydrorhamnose 3,5-epimerase